MSNQRAIKKHLSSRYTVLSVFVFLFIFIFSVGINNISLAAINKSINIQGKFTNLDGTNLTNSDASCITTGANNDTCDFRISLYDESSVGTLLWQQQINDQELENYDGVFSLDLDFSTGYETGYSSKIFNNEADDGSPLTGLYMETEFDANGDSFVDGLEEEMFTTRSQFNSVPSAFNAERLAGRSADDFVQIVPGSVQTTGDITSSVININENGTGTNNFIELEQDATDVFVVDNNGNVILGQDGTQSYLYFADTAGNESLSWDGTSFLLSNSLVPDMNDVYTLGTSTSRWADLYVGPSSLHIGVDGNEAIVGYNTAGSYLDFQVGGGSVLNLTSTALYPSTPESLSIGTATAEWNEIFIGDNEGITIGLDDDWVIAYDELTDSRLEFIGNTGMLIESSVAVGNGLDMNFNGITDGTAIALSADGVTTGNGVVISVDGLTTGVGFAVESTSVALDTGQVADIEWNPTALATADGDVLRVGVGANGTLNGNILGVQDGGVDVFSVSQTQITADLPVAFTSPGDVSMGYDQVFTNQTASNINSYGPLAINAGESFESNNLTLSTYNSGDIILNSGDTGEVVISGNVIPGVDDVYTLGATDARWKDIYVGPNSLHIGTDSGEAILGYSDGNLNLTVGGEATSLTQTQQLVQDFVVASGENISAGDVVSYIDGEIAKGFGVDLGSSTEFNPDGVTYLEAATLSTTKFILVYRDDGNGSYGTAVIGEVSGQTVTFGTEYVFNTANTFNMEVVSLSSTKIVIAYEDVGNSQYGTVIVGDVSGTVITFGSEQVFAITDITDIGLDALTSSRVVITHSTVTLPYEHKAVIGDVSGTVVTFGSDYIYSTGSATYIHSQVTALSATKFVVVHGQTDGAIVGDVSGTVITFGSSYEFNTASVISEVKIISLSATKIIVAYRPYSSYVGKVVVGDVSGTVITFGSPVTYTDGSTSFDISSISPTQFAIAYKNYIGSGSTYVDGKIITGTVSGNNIVLGNAYSYLSTTQSQYNSVIALSSNKVLVGYRDESDTSGKVVVGDMYGGQSVIGLAKTSGTAGETIPIVIEGVSKGHVGLTPGGLYYANEDGGVTTIARDYLLGIAISSTELLLNKDSESVNQYYGDMIFTNEFRITEAQGYEGLIFKNQLGKEVFILDEYGSISPGVSGVSNIGSADNYYNGIYADTYYGKNTNISNFDLAEEYQAVDMTIGAGDVVAPVYGSDITIDRTNKKYQNNVMGVISTDPGITLSHWDSAEDVKEKMRPIALAGRVPVKVTTENGPIKKGDHLVPASKAGYAMAACGPNYCEPGMSIGMALEDFNEDQAGDSQDVVKDLEETKIEIEEKIEEIEKSIDTQEIIAEKSNDSSTLLEVENDKDQIEEVKKVTEELTSIKTDEVGNGRVMMYVNLTYYMGSYEEDESVLNSIGYGDNTLTGSNEADAEKLEEMLFGSKLEGVVSLDKLVVSEILVTGDAQFTGDIEIGGHVAFNEDTIGQAKVLEEATEVKVEFEKEYSTLPIVTITLATDIELDRYFVSDVSTSGFTIKIYRQKSLDCSEQVPTLEEMLFEEEIECEDEYIDSEVIFNWHAFASYEGNIFLSSDDSNTEGELGLEGDDSNIEEEVLEEDVLEESLRDCSVYEEGSLELAVCDELNEKDESEEIEILDSEVREELQDEVIGESEVENVQDEVLEEETDVVLNDEIIVKEEEVKEVVVEAPASPVVEDVVKEEVPTDLE